MARRSYREQLIAEELEAHVADMTADLIEQGVSEQEAKQQAQEAFGDIEEAQRQTLLQYPMNIWQRFGPVFCIGGPYSVLSIVFLTMWLLMRRSLIGVMLEPFFLWWVFTGVIAMSLLIVKWFLDFSGLTKMQGVAAAMVFVLLEALSITNVLDINDFEVNIHAVLLSAVLFVVMQLFWKRISVLIKNVIVFAFTVIVAWSALTQEPIFGFLGTARCLYIKASEEAIPEVVAMCSQVPFLSRLLLPIHLLLLIGVPFLLYFFVRYWKCDATAFWRKAVISCALAALPLTPVFVNDVNTLGGLDVIPWKSGIYRAYWETLGRRPEDKDFEFYARTRAYENINQVKNVLFESEERRLKIRLIFLEVLNRYPTKAEVKEYIENKKAVDDIYEELKTFNE